MHCFDNGFVIRCVIIGLVFINCGQEQHVRANSESDKDEDITPEDLYTFIALIDLVFTDGMKKTCTGTIIHDCVVITAAHCFQLYDDNVVEAELTASFVVIGTKKMFETGYEQYLPIERVIIHPNYSGWTADLALVYTFASMVSDKPGLVVPLASEKTITPVDSDVTVFSWGQFQIISNMPLTATPIADRSSSGEKYTTSDGQNVTSYKLLQSNTEEDIEKISSISHEIEQTKTSPHQKKRQRKRRKKSKNTKGIRQRKQNIQNQEKYYLRQTSAEIRSKYRYQPLQYDKEGIIDRETKLSSWEKQKGNLKQIYTYTPRALSYRTSRKSFKATSYYRNNWRRKIGYQQSKLAVEIFGFVNMQMCKKILDKATPSHKLKNPHEVMCYASDGHFITEADSGAPAMRRGRLVAMTVGGVNVEGERVAVGLKMTCFCSWISDNIPSVDTKWHCCKNCCETKDHTEQKDVHYRQGRRKKLVQNDKK